MNQLSAVADNVAELILLFRLVIESVGLKDEPLNSYKNAAKNVMAGFMLISNLMSSTM